MFKILLPTSKDGGNTDAQQTKNRSIALNPCSSCYWWLGGSYNNQSISLVEKLHSPHKELMMLAEPFGILVFRYSLIIFVIICLVALPFYIHYSQNQKEV